MPKYICTDKCFHNGSLYRKGDVADFAEGEYPVSNEGELRHFRLIEGAPKKEVAPPAAPKPAGVMVDGKDKK